jgi:16S rRNA (cytidine1402-2'-O)-methyltransferase
MSHPDSNAPIASIASSILTEASQQTYPGSALYVLATPIGNVCDMTLRALHVLTIANAVACEDTRNTSHLLTRYGISQTLIAAHQHNEREAAGKIIARLQQGERIALVSDAGTPAVSDPGARIVAAVRAAGLTVVPLPGASAAVAALSVSGLVNDTFYFIGFLPNRSRQRENVLLKHARDSATLVFYEAPHRIVDTVDALLQAFGPQRQIILARELTKLFETIHCCALVDAPAWLAADLNRQRGEFVILVEGAPADADTDTDAERVLQILLAELPLKQAAALAAQITGQKKSVFYERALQIRDSR